MKQAPLKPRPQGAHRARMRRQAARRRRESLPGGLLRRCQLHSHGVPGMVFIAHPPSWARCTPWPNWRSSRHSVAATGFLCTWTAHVSPMAWPLPTPMSPWPTSRASPTPSTSAAPNAERSAARRSCSRAAACPGTSSPTPSSTAPCWPRGVCSACSSTRCSPITCTAKWDVWPSQPPTSCAASCARRVHLLPRKPHQSTVRGSGKCPGRGAGRAHPLQHLGKARDGRTVIRLVTSWSTTPDDLAALEAALHEVMQ